LTVEGCLPCRSGPRPRSFALAYLGCRRAGASSHGPRRGGKAPIQTQAETEDFYARRDVSFEDRPGEPVGIIGPNGSGKSTSLKILAGVTKPSSGRFELNGRHRVPGRQCIEKEGGRL